MNCRLRNGPGLLPQALEICFFECIFAFLAAGVKWNVGFFLHLFQCGDLGDSPDTLSLRLLSFFAGEKIFDDNSEKKPGFSVGVGGGDALGAVGCGERRQSRSN